MRQAKAQHIRLPSSSDKLPQIPGNREVQGDEMEPVD
jgi:hypothetical protein